MTRDLGDGSDDDWYVSKFGLIGALTEDQDSKHPRHTEAARSYA